MRYAAAAKIAQIVDERLRGGERVREGRVGGGMTGGGVAGGTDEILSSVVGVERTNVVKPNASKL